jgi:hypothetical protein
VLWEKEMATKKKSTSKKSSSGSDPKSKRIVKGKVGETMHEYKRHELSSGRSGKKVASRKQAIAIGLSEAREAGAKIPAAPGGKTAAKKKAASKTSRKATTKKTAAKKKAPAKKKR